MDIKKIIEEKCNIVVDSIKLIGEGYDSKAYIVNNEYVFKIKFSANKKKGYEKEKAIYDFLNKKNINIQLQIQTNFPPHQTHSRSKRLSY